MAHGVKASAISGAHEYKGVMASTVGIHLIWTAYGTWLPGDPSKPGHWSPLFDMYGRLIRAGHRLNLPHAPTYARARSLMNEPPKVLDEAEQAIVADVIGSHIVPPHIAPALAGETDVGDRATPAKAGQTGRPPALAGAMWASVRAYACAIEPTHVHLLVGPVREDIGRFVGRLKGTSSSAVLQHPANRDRTRVWTAGYWKVFLFDDDALPPVAAYIERHNTRRGLPVAPHPWLTPRPA